jgi:hypothetical protein
MLRTIGPQDGEQVFPFWIRDGLDYPDFIYAFNSKPYRILSAVRDFFPIGGARQSFEEAKTVYSRIGARERLSMFEADDGHGYTHPRRLAGYAWFARWLKNEEDRAPEPEIRLATERELQCTETGQVVKLPGAESVFSLNRARAEQIHRPSLAPDALARRVRELTGYEAATGSVSTRSYGTIARDGYHIEKLVYDSEPGIQVPALLFVPDAAGSGRKPALVYFNGRGKAAGVSDDIEPFVKAGFLVLSIDARGIGETRWNNENNPTDFTRYFGDYDSAMTAILIGKTMPGMRARDITRGVDMLAGRNDVDASAVFGYGKDGGAVPMLYAAVLDNRLHGIALEGMLISYDWVIRHRIHWKVFEDVVPWALKSFDFSDLVSSIATRPVWIVNAVNGLGHTLPLSEVQRNYEGAARAFSAGGARERLHISERRPGDTTANIYSELFQATHP